MLDKAMEAQLKRLLARYVEHHVEHGKALPTEELCRGTPELRHPLLQLIREYHKLDRSLAPRAHLQAGERLSSYRIQSLLGAGGMGAVYKAEDLKLARTVAIKVLHPEMAADPERLQRFEQEARSASALNHPNIITIYDIDRHNGAPFIAMEYVQGSTLTELMDRGRLPLVRTLHYAVQIADGLARAHHRGIVHRDLKPDNLMVTEDDLVKILDFGLAKLTDPADWSGAASPDPGHPSTQDGHILGTAPYMSPEQAQGERVDFRSDIFSFGSVLYEMVTGRRPFAGDSAVTLLAAIIEKEPEPAGSLIPSIPLELERVIQRALHKEPRRRFQSSADLRVELVEIKEALESGNVVSAEQVLEATKGRRRAVGIWIVAALAAMAVGLGAWIYLTALEPPRPPAETVQLTSLEGREDWPALSPDGTRVAFSWDGGDVKAVSELYVTSIGATDLHQLTFPPGGGRTPAWSPDGSRIAFTRGRPGDFTIYEISALGRRGSERRLGASIAGGWPHLSWSPSGTHLAVRDKASPNSPDAIFLLSAETGEKRQLSRPPPFLEGRQKGDMSPAFSPDGRSVAFLRKRKRMGNRDLYLVEVSSGKEKRLIPDHDFIGSVDWTPDGQHLVFSQSSGLGLKSLWSISRTGGEPVRLGVGEGAGAISTSRARDRLVYSRSTHELNVWRVAGPAAAERTSPSRFIASTRADHRPRYSPDGSRIAFTTTRSGRSEVWVCDSSGGECGFLTAGGDAAWSPDGKHLAFASETEDVATGISIIDAEGGFPHLIADVDDGEFWRSPNWSRDGQWIYFRSYRTGRSEIWKIRPDGEGLQQVTRGGGFWATESADGRYLYYGIYEVPRQGQYWKVSGQIRKVPVGGGKDTLVLYRPRPRSWNIWNGYLIYSTFEGEAGPSIESLNLETGEVTTVAKLEPGASLRHGLSVSPDGKWIAYANWEGEGSDLYLVENFFVD